MKRGFTVLVFFSILSCLITEGQPGRRYIRTGDGFLRKGLISEAVEQYSRAIVEAPASADGYIRRARARETQGDVQSACGDYRSAVALMPDDAAILYNLGRICNILGSEEGVAPEVRRNHHSDALSYLQKAVSKDPRNGRFHTEKTLSLIGLERWSEALVASDMALQMSDDALNNYYRGIILLRMGEREQAREQLERSIARDKSNLPARLLLARLLRELGDTESALEQYSVAARLDPENDAVYYGRALVHKVTGDYTTAINDLSLAIVLNADGWQYYMARGDCYQQLKRHGEAVEDFSSALQYEPERAGLYMSRAASYIEAGMAGKATADYQRVLALSGEDSSYADLRTLAAERLFVINRESDPPEIILEIPAATDERVIEVNPQKNRLTVSGRVNDKSPLKEIMINKVPVTVDDIGTAAFTAEIDITGKEKLLITACDVYDNQSVSLYHIRRAESDPPVIEIVTPWLAEGDRLIIDSNASTIDIEGRVLDESLIRSVTINNISAQFSLDQMNPSFTAKEVNVRSKDKITIFVEDKYGNFMVKDYLLSRNGTTISSSNPMGRTLVVFIENSDYQDFTALQGPVKDATLITGVLEDEYQVLPIKRLSNQTKQQMEKFFSIELRDEIKTRKIKSLVIWYAGHGKFINDVGYWIPVDARRDEEFTYFSLSMLKASLETYVNHLSHVLVVTDACGSGPGFYQAMRSDPRQRDCDDWRDTRFRSRQIFSSAGHELAVDDSRFTRTFASALQGNSKSCISIDEIVRQVSGVVAQNNQQRPVFGKIPGLNDEDGTFFFVKK